MKTRFLTIAVIGAGVATSAWAMRQTEVDVVSNLSDAGEKITHPDPAHPVFYLPVMSGFMEPVDPVAHGEHPPPANEVAHQVAVVLSRQGYYAARPGLRVNAKMEIAYADGTVVTVPTFPSLNHPLHFNRPGDDPLTVSMIESRAGPYSFHLAHRVGPHRTLSPLIQVFRTVDPVHGPVLQAMPAIVLVIQWGDLHSGFNGGGAAHAFDLPIWVSMLAGDHFKDSSYWDRDDVLQRTSADRFFVVVAAYDFKSCLGGRKKQLLWKTRMSVPSNAPGAEFAAMLPMLLKAGEPHLGRETNHAVLTVVPAVREGTVSIGRPVVTEADVIPDTGSDKFLPLHFEPNP